MSFLDKYIPMISKIIIGGEEMLNLCELVKCIETDKTPPLIEECIITPYYINESGRYELYQYEFCAEQRDGATFEKYLLRITGKKKIEEVPDDIIGIRKICFSQIDVNNQSSTLKKVIEYFHFLMYDEEVQSEVIGIFTEFDINNIYVCIL